MTRTTFALLLLTSFLPGCGPVAPTIARVTGKVTLEGDPVTKGVIQFESDKGFTASALLLTGGAYQVRSQHGDGLPLGRYAVSIVPPPSDQQKAPEKAALEPAPIPQKYRNAKTSGLVAEVKTGGGPFDFDLKK